jgi:hypothetical protein
VSDPAQQWTEVWEDDGAWHWRFVAQPAGGEDPVELPANEPESSRYAAEQAARTAYPELEVRVMAAPGEPGEPESARHLREAVVAAVIAGALLLAHPRRWTAGTALVTAFAAARQYRRSARG